MNHIIVVRMDSGDWNIFGPLDEGSYQATAKHYSVGKVKEVSKKQISKCTMLHCVSEDEPRDILKEIASSIDGQQYPLALDEEMLKNKGIVIVYVSPDGVVKFEGAYCAKFPIPHDRCRSTLISSLGRMIDVHASPWLYAKYIPHETFDLMEDGYGCSNGLVFYALPDESWESEDGFGIETGTQALKKLANYLDGRDYACDFSDVVDGAHSRDIIIAHPTWDDFIMFEGAQYKKFGVNRGQGIVSNLGRHIDTMWSSTDSRWVYSTHVPHESFNLTMQCNMYREGIVFYSLEGETWEVTQ